MYMQNKNVIRKVCKESQTLCKSQGWRKDAAKHPWKMRWFIHSTPHLILLIISHVASLLRDNKTLSERTGFKLASRKKPFWGYIFLARICVHRGIWGDFSLNFRMIRISNVLINISPCHSVFSELFVQKIWGVLCCVLQAILFFELSRSFPFRALICIFPTICYSGLLVVTY